MVQFPFTNYKTVSVNSTSNNFTIYTATAKCMLVFEPASDHNGAIFFDAGTNQHLISRVATGSASTSGSIIIPSGAQLDGSGAGGTRVHGILHIFELP